MPEGLLAVATPLDIAGYKVHIIDQRLEPDWEQILQAELKARPVCVGITAMTGPQIAGALKASEVVKRNSDVPVVWGGIHATLLPRQTLENENVDIVVQEEGEETFLELVNALAARRSIADIKGIWWKTGGIIKENQIRPYINLNLQPLPSYHLVNLKRYASTIGGHDCLPIETSRGCAFGCAFCYNTRFHRQKWRSLTPEQTLLRIKELVEKYKISGLLFRDDNFFTHPSRAHEILEGIVKQNSNLVWGKGDIRLDTIVRFDHDYLSLIEQSHCLSLVIGIESGSQRIADLIRKQIDISEVIPVNRRLSKYNMHIRYLFLTGIPGETKSDLEASVSLMLRLVRENHRSSLGVQKFVPYPATELFDISTQYGLLPPQKLEEWIPYGWINRELGFPWISSENLKLIQMITLCSVFLTEVFNPHGDTYPLISLVEKVYAPIARKRFEGLHYRFLPELKIAKMLGYKGY